MDEIYKKLNEAKQELKGIQTTIFNGEPGTLKMSEAQFKDFYDLANDVNKAIYFLNHAISCAIRLKENEE